MRVSQENVHSRGTKSDQSPSPQGTQTSFRLTFSKSARIRKRKQFKEIARARQRFFGRSIVIDFRHGNAPRLGITVPRQFGNAVKRSRFKRLIREVFRTLRPQLPPFDLVVHPKKGIEWDSFAAIKEDFLDFHVKSTTGKSS